MGRARERHPWLRCSTPLARRAEALGFFEAGVGPVAERCGSGACGRGCRGPLRGRIAGRDVLGFGGSQAPCAFRTVRQLCL